MLFRMQVQASGKRLIKPKVQIVQARTKGESHWKNVLQRLWSD